VAASRRRSLHEAAHKLGNDVREEPVRSTLHAGERRSLNEAAHKLGDWAPPALNGHEQESEATRRRFEALADSQRDVIAHAGRAALGLGALGVVYGDIGTSPLYTEQVIFGSYKATAHITPAAAYGVVSLIFWALTIVVSIKYAGFIMRAHNRGDGGIMALTACCIATGWFTARCW
jgi:K+ potassium transporter